MRRTRTETRPCFLQRSDNHPEVAATLLAFKADPNIRNKNGQTPLDFAKRPRQPAPGGLRIPVPLAPGTAVPVSSSAPTLVIDLATLLREHGALDNLPHLDRIELTRPSANFSTEAFSKGPNDWNRFTLLEAVAQLYGFINVQKAGESSPKTVSRDAVGWRNVGLGFPDFKAVVIHRPSADGKSWKNIPVDVGAILGSGDCSRDVWLQWGDVVEIPEADHPVSERWAGFAEPELNTLIKCVSRTITISINNTNVAFQLAPVFVVPQRGTPMDFYGEFLSPVEAGRRLVSFMVRSVLDQSKLIRFSSDLSRVKVTRRDAATGKTQSWVLDCSGGNLPDLWLRDGDVIEVPEK